MRILIIEDENITAEDLMYSIKEVRKNFEVVKTISSVKSGISFLKTQPLIDLIFSDIQLTDGLSFEIFKEVDVQVPIIFCTAYDEYALNAFDANGIAYLLKPFTTETIEKAIQKFEKLTHQNDNKINRLIQFMEHNVQKASPSILIHQGEKIIPVNFDNTALLYLKNGVVKVQTFDKNIYTAAETLEELNNIQFPDFFRANRQCLIHRKAIKSAAKYFNRRLVLHLNIPFEEKIVISKEKAPSFLEWLAKK